MRKTIGDLTVNYSIDGEGPPLVLVHGAGADLISWEEMIPGLAAHFTVYAYDQRGFGQTLTPDSPALALDVWTQDLLLFLDAMKLDSPILVGWSLGGCVVLDFACEHPDRTGIVIPIGCRGPHREERDLSGFQKRMELAQSGASAQEMIDATFDFTKKAFSQWTRDHHPQGVQKIRDMLVRNNPRHYAQMVHALDGASDFGPKLSRLCADVFIICGTEDGRTPPHMSQALQVAIPGSSLSMLPDCGHYYPYEKPTETNQLILEYLL